MRIYTESEVFDLNDTTVINPSGNYKLDFIKISDTDLFKCNLLTEDAFKLDDYDGYQTNKFKSMRNCTEPFPHIQVKIVSDGYEVEDGHHRLILAVERGDKIIKAFIPIGGKNENR